MDALKTWLRSEQVRRALRTAAQVLVPVAILALRDYGQDGVIVWRDYIFGDGGFIVAAATGIALYMNRK